VACKFADIQSGARVSVCGALGSNSSKIWQIVTPEKDQETSTDKQTIMGAWSLCRRNLGCPVRVRIHYLRYAISAGLQQIKSWVGWNLRRIFGHWIQKDLETGSNVNMAQA
jgi:hypothetical protein